MVNLNDPLIKKQRISLIWLLMILFLCIILLYTLLFFSNRASDPIKAISVIGFEVVANGTLFFIPWYVLVYLKSTGHKKACVVLGLRPTASKNFLWVIPCVVIIYTGSFLWVNLLYLLPQNMGVSNGATLMQQYQYFPISLWDMLFCSITIVPFAEEVFFRGVIFQLLNRHFSIVLSAIISAAIFALLHLNVIGIGDYFLFGVCSVFIFRRTKSLWPSIGLHVLMNLIAGIVILQAYYHIGI